MKYRFIIIIIIIAIDIAVLMNNIIIILELTVCHEINLTKSKQYKVSKYSNISSSLTAAVTNCSVKVFTVEVSTLGFISDISDFCKVCLLNKLPTSVKTSIVNAAVSNSYYIYCNRNNAVEN